MEYEAALVGGRRIVVDPTTGMVHLFDAPRGQCRSLRLGQNPRRTPEAPHSTVAVSVRHTISRLDLGLGIAIAILAIAVALMGHWVPGAVACLTGYVAVMQAVIGSDELVIDITYDTLSSQLVYKLTNRLEAHAIGRALRELAELPHNVAKLRHWSPDEIPATAA